MACSGAPAEKCGGPNAINIYNYNSLPYTVGPASAIFSYNGYSGYSNDVYGGLCYRFVSTLLRLYRLLIMSLASDPTHSQSSKVYLS